MSDYIDRQAAIEAVGDIHPLDYNSQAIANRLKSLPSADVAPVRHGRWIDETFSFSRPRCSVCGELCIGLHAFSYVLTDYCPHCGARMDGEQDDGKGND